jgi:hypothetical protein
VVALGVPRREDELAVHVDYGSKEGPHVHLGTLGKLAIQNVGLGSLVVTGAAECLGKTLVIGETKIGKLKAVFPLAHRPVEDVFGLDITVA